MKTRLVHVTRAATRLLGTSLALITLYACTDSETTDSIIEAGFQLQVESYFIENNELWAINNNPIETSAPQAQRLVANTTSLVLFDTDLSGERDDEDFLSDRGISAELALYVKSAEPSKVFLLDLQSRREQELFDLNTNNNTVGDSIICELKPSDIPDILRLQDDVLEIKQEQTVFLLTAVSDCADEQFSFALSFEVDRTRSYSVRQPVLQDQEDDATTDPVYEIESVRYSEFSGTRASIDAARVIGPQIEVDTRSKEFGVFGTNLDAGGTVSSFQFYAQIEPTRSDLFATWNTLPGSNTQPRIEIDAFNLTKPFSAFVSQNSLFTITEEQMFDQILETARAQALQNPIYTAGNVATLDPSDVLLLPPDRFVIIDGEQIDFIENDGSNRVLSDQTGVYDEIEIIPQTIDIVVETTDSSNKQSLILIDQTGIETVIIGATENIQSYAYQDYFDYHMIDTGMSIDARFAQAHNSGAAIFTPAIENSAWLSLKNYLEDRTEQYILNAATTEGGILQSPGLYRVDTLEEGARGALLGNFAENIAVIEEAAIVGKRFGAIWSRASFEVNAPIQLHYFNPSDDTWTFTLVDEDTELPAWLPNIAP